MTDSSSSDLASRNRSLLKVHFDEAKEQCVSYRTLDIDLNNSVGQLLFDLKNRYGYQDSSTCTYGLCLVDSKSSSWLHESRKLSEYISAPLKKELHFRNAMVSIKVTDLSGTIVKKIIVDSRHSVQQVVGNIALRFSLSRPGDFALETEHKGRVSWLDLHTSLADNAIAPDSTLVLRQRMLFPEPLPSTSDPLSLHWFYIESKQGVVFGQHPLSKQQAMSFAALQMQIAYGDYDPLVHVAGFLKLHEVLKPSFCSELFIEDAIYKKHRKLKGINELEAKLRYVKKFVSLPTFGATFFAVKERLSESHTYDHDLLVGVNHDAIFISHPVSQTILSRYPLHERDGKTYRTTLTSDAETHALLTASSSIPSVPLTPSSASLSVSLMAARGGSSSPNSLSTLSSPALRMTLRSPEGGGRYFAVSDTQDVSMLLQLIDGYRKEKSGGLSAAATSGTSSSSSSSSSAAMSSAAGGVGVGAGGGGLGAALAMAAGEKMLPWGGGDRLRSASLSPYLTQSLQRTTTTTTSSTTATTSTSEAAPSPLAPIPSQTSDRAKTTKKRSVSAALLTSSSSSSSTATAAASSLSPPVRV